VVNDLERVRTVLADHRRAGVAFEVAWPRAVGSIVDYYVRAAVANTRASWASAYDDRPTTRSEDAVAMLGGAA
jgi:hypothetical protein